MIYIILALTGICAALLLIVWQQAKEIGKLDSQLYLSQEDANPLYSITIDAQYFDIVDDLPELGDNND